MALHKLIASLIVANLLAGIAAAATPSDPLEPAKAAIRIKEYEQAVEWLQAQARNNNAAAQYLLGTMYLSGLGVTANETTAGQWFDRAAKLGNNNAINLLKANASLRAIRNSPTTDFAVKRDLFWMTLASNDAAALSGFEDKELIEAADDFGRSALHRAAAIGAGNSVQWLLAHGAHSTADHFGVTSLMLAAAAKESSAMAPLLQIKPDLVATDQAGNTALMYAARYARESQLTALLAAGADVKTRNQSGWSALEFAQQAEAASIAALLQAKGATSIRHATNASAPSKAASGDVTRPPAKTPDLYAGWMDVAVLVSRDNGQLVALSNSAASQNTSLLMIAVNNDAASSIAALLAKGFDASQTDAQGATPLVVAARSGHFAALRALLAGGVTADTHAAKEDSPLLAATRAGQLDSVRELLHSNANVNSVDAHGNSALIIATQLERRDIVTVLLQRDASTNVVNNSKRSALWFAAGNGSAILQDLISAHATVDLVDSKGITPLLNAVAHGQTNAMEILIAAGANARAKTAGGETALILAAATGNKATITRLLNNQSELDAQSANGETALIAASRAGHDDIVEMLLNAGASAKLRNSEKASALDVARNLGFTTIVARLDRR